MIRFATVGTSKITERFLEAAGECKELVYEAAYSRDMVKAEEFARKHGAKKGYSDLKKMAEDADIDAVYIASPNRCHCEQAVLMMSHKKHVLCEKPIASNRGECERMVESAQKNNVVLLEAIRSVFDPGFAAVTDNLYKLGPIRGASFRFCQYSSRYDNFKKGIVENAFKPELSNGALMDIGVYCVHPLVKLFGVPPKVRADAVFLDNGVDGAGAVLAGYEDMQAELIYSKITDSAIPSEIRGEDGCMMIEDMTSFRRVEIIYRDGRKEVIVFREKRGNLIYEIREWARLIESGQSGEEYLQISLMEMQLMDEVRRRQGIVFPADEI